MTPGGGGGGGLAPLVFRVLAGELLFEGGVGFGPKVLEAAGDLDGALVWG